MNIKKLKEQYDKRKIGEIEKEIKTKNELSLIARKDAVFALRYLELSGRWKENPTYKKSSFKEYLMGYYSIREGSYREQLRAFTKFEDEALKYGVGIIGKVLRDCGAKKEKLVVEEIKKADKALKNPIQRAKIDTIIKKYAKPKPAAQPGYKSLYIAERRKNERLMENLTETRKENIKLKAQIEKLKATVLELRPYVAIKDAVMPFIHQETQVESRVN